VAARKSLNKAKKVENEKASDGQDKFGGKEYERELARLHGELVKLQLWVVAKGLKVVILFEGRDGAGKGGSARASIASSRCPHRPSARSRRCMFNATCAICLRPAKS
jgi:polyphosphate kinase 2 (PPK2 family)